MDHQAITLLLLTDDEQAYSHSRVWGTGGWLPPQDREALDWLTLAKLNGWRPSLAAPTIDALREGLNLHPHWVILACDPGTIDDAFVEEIATTLASTELVILARVSHSDLPLSRFTGAYLTEEVPADTRLHWIGKTPFVFSVRSSLPAHALQLSPDSQPLLLVGQLPIIAMRRVGQGCIISLGFHPSAARDESGILTRLLRQTLVECSERAVAWLDFSRTMILRMDDPGAAQNVYLKTWAYPELNYSQWREIGRILAERHARLSVGYCSGWVDDGDPSRGVLTGISGFIERVSGQVCPSAEITYLDKMGALPGTFHDYAGEYHALSELRRIGLVDIELHGYTHMYPDSTLWANSSDRYDAVGWFREIGPRAKELLARLSKEEHPLSRGVSALKRYFDIRPTTLICPGDEWTNEALEHALDLGVSLVSSYYLALRHEDRLCWTTHVCAPYLDEHDRAWFDSELPLIGYFHDREPSVYGCSWFAQCLDRWTSFGAQRFLSFRDLAFQLNVQLGIESSDDRLVVSVCGDSPTSATAPVRLYVHVPGARKKLLIDAAYGGSPCSVRFEWVGESTAYAEVTAASVPARIGTNP